jgi:2-dehydro-3-deoxyphosphooctonate aldolase (KDO 8-P synthase)
MKGGNDVKKRIRQVRISETITIGDGGLVAICGPCVIEDRKKCLDVAAAIAEIARGVGIPVIFKSSFDKANRSSARSFRGVGLARGLSILADVREKYGLPILSDIHLPEQARPAGEVLDVLQIPAFLCRQTDLLLAAGATGRAVNIKKGQFMSPWEMANAAEKIESTGNRRIMLTERGTTFGYNNLVVDFTSLPIMRDLGYPVVFDGTHSVQMPGGRGSRSGGRSRFVPALIRAAAAVGCDALFIETHPAPKTAPSDGDNMIPLKNLKAVLADALAIHRLRLEQ